MCQPLAPVILYHNEVGASFPTCAHKFALHLFSFWRKQTINQISANSHSSQQPPLCARQNSHWVARVAVAQTLYYYFTFDASPYYLWASLLDPRIGYTTLEAVFKEDYGLLDDLKSSQKSLEAEFNDNYTRNSALSSPTRPSEPSSSRIPTQTGGSAQKSFLGRVRASQTSLTPEDELKRYFQMTSVPLTFETTDLLGWWYASRAAFLIQDSTGYSL
ncbi:hypothetical protein B0H11DRAFT_1933635 [Mycena galericulata]|nr:hypothetical protein B0H11DRAFT_1933635 [Mycena galericulata]